MTRFIPPYVGKAAMRADPYEVADALVSAILDGALDDEQSIRQAVYEVAGRFYAQADIERRTELTPVAASVVRLEGGCVKGHRAGRWHVHEEPYHALGRRLAGIAAARRPAPQRA